MPEEALEPVSEEIAKSMVSGRQARMLQLAQARSNATPTGPG